MNPYSYPAQYPELGFSLTKVLKKLTLLPVKTAVNLIKHPLNFRAQVDLLKHPLDLKRHLAFGLSPLVNALGPKMPGTVSSSAAAVALSPQAPTSPALPIVPASDPISYTPTPGDGGGGGGGGPMLSPSGGYEETTPPPETLVQKAGMPLLLGAGLLLVLLASPAVKVKRHGTRGKR